MSHQQHEDQRIKRALKRFSKPQKIVLYIRLLVWLWLYRLRSLVVHFIWRPRARIHWVGHWHRPRRHERALFILIFLLSMFLLEPREYAYWSMMWGGTLSIFINLHTIYRLIPRKQYHWMR